MTSSSDLEAQNTICTIIRLSVFWSMHIAVESFSTVAWKIVKACKRCTLMWTSHRGFGFLTRKSAGDNTKTPVQADSWREKNHTWWRRDLLHTQTWVSSQQDSPSPTQRCITPLKSLSRGNSMPVHESLSTLQWQIDLRDLWPACMLNATTQSHGTCTCCCIAMSGCNFTA